ncbi:MAG: preprotein translocase subunit SecA [Acidobacteria bacterium]|nr:preprotein translocase subunit SecA [Acidobacteriota bacterium]
MVDAVLAKIFGTKHEREVKRIKPKVEAINNLEAAMRQLSDAELTAKTAEFKQRIANGSSLDELLVEAFAVCREASRRVLNMRHFDVQLIGGAILHEGKIAEMRTGEGKTLVATLPCYLNALEGKGVHVVTVNDYLAKRDSEWMGRLHEFLGLSVGCIVHDISEPERRQAYASDITYGTNNEFGFDYLRDNMKFRLESCVQRPHHFAIVDEVDSILIDEARTPLIISGPSEESTDKYYRINTIIPKLVRGEVIQGKEQGEKYFTGDYTVDEKQRNVALTEEGVHKVERLLNCGNLYDIENMELNHHVQQGLRAHVLYQRDREYVVQNGEVVIVDEFTGRLMPGRRWSDGLHQAVEAKEGVKIERENQTLATVTFQNYFRMYKKLGGMTGTADTEAAEFGKTYKLDVVLIPTNQSMIRKDLNDIVYRTEEEKFRNAAKEIKQLHEKGQPVLVGTISVEKSERLSGHLRRIGVRHEVLNAKNHEREAFIIAQAGRKGAVTVSTNMAGRGTDILLGGNAEFLAKDQMRRAGKDPEGVHAEEYKQLYVEIKKQTDAEHDEVSKIGGLFVLGTERHESRRIDNQLRGRAGRQGDPGGSRFYLSLQDDLLRIFGGDKIQGLMLRLGMEEDVPIESSLITRRIEAAQKSVEANHFSARKHLLEYDDVMNKQRTAVYELRRAMLSGTDQKNRVREMITSIVGAFIDARLAEGVRRDQWDFDGLASDVLTQFGVKIDTDELDDMGRELVEQEVIDKLNARYDEKEALVSSEVMRETERMILLNVIDNQWKDHLLSMDHLKEGIYLRGYGQKDPLIEYKKESFTLFQDMMARIEDEAIRFLYFLQPYDEHGNILTGPPIQMDDDDEEDDSADEPAPVAAPVTAASITDFTRNIQRKKEKELEALQYVGGDSTSSTKPQPVVKGVKVGRNDPCPCGSGKKFKKCHGV